MTTRRAFSSFGVFLALAVLCPHVLPGQLLDLRGQLSALARLSGDPLNGLTSVRYLPNVFIALPVGEEQTIDGELAFDGVTSVRFPARQRREHESSLDLYRGWMRFASQQFEFRAGLQKITFGSASLFRPLMWFDAMDPRDPLQITTGVYALLGRYYFANSANLWLWGVYGRDELKGWESIPSRTASAEYGGRIQMPLGAGEAALSYHHRQAELTLTAPGPFGVVSRSSLFPEDRIGFDGKWDIGPGIWVEGTVTRQYTDLLPFPWQQSMTVGMDYTVSIGNGLNVLGEYSVQTATAKGLGSGLTLKLAGCSLTYPVTILDDASAILYYDQAQSDAYAFFSWRRTYDDWILNLILFTNPQNAALLLPSQRGLALPGTGGMLMVVFNH